MGIERQKRLREKYVGKRTYSLIKIEENARQALRLTTGMKAADKLMEKIDVIDEILSGRK
jgi:hypothetical protein